MKTEIVI